jgi:ABC-type glutathione transport system ATPase component
MGDLSSGTQGTLLWIWFLAIELANFSPRPRVRRWHEQPSILLIDEIENHLHPTWQRRVIPALLEHFPGLQIFATTHSPFVVAGLKAGQVHLLNRDANGVITASTNTEDIVGWTADEILRTMMGVHDPTDDATAAAARELRQLRDEGPRADVTEEERRQGRMQELRRLVDRDLLAGGPMARRREDFAKRFREVMERRTQAEELNQDNG